MVARVQGKVTLGTPAGLARAFDGVCSSVSDNKTGGVGRCTWTDARGDQIIIEISGSILGSAGSAREVKGKVVSDTGRYAGVEGDFAMDWIFVSPVRRTGGSRATSPT